MALALLLPAIAHSQNIVLVQSNNDQVYAQFTQSFRDTLSAANPALNLILRDADNFTGKETPDSKAGASIYVAVGTRAAQSLAMLPEDTPRLLALIPAEFYESTIRTDLYKCPPPACRVLLLDQPIERQLALIRTALPGHKRVLVLAQSRTRSTATRLEPIAQAYGLTVRRLVLEHDSTMIQQLQLSLTDADVLLAIPDAAVYNRNTARPILLASYKANIPVVAYSSAFVDAGAALGVYTTPQQFGQHCAELAADLAAGRNKSLRGVLAPRYFTIRANHSVLESMNLHVPSIEYLHKALAEGSP